MEKIDLLLKKLGAGTPFEVDWDAYNREVLRRIARAEAARNRKSIWILLAGALSGAAAMIVIMNSFSRIETNAPRESMPRAEVADVERAAPSVDYIRIARSNEMGTSAIRAVLESKGPNEHRQENSKPFVRRSGSSEIRFDGFSDSKSSEAGFIVARPPTR